MKHRSKLSWIVIMVLVFSTLLVELRLPRRTPLKRRYVVDHRQNKWDNRSRDAKAQSIENVNVLQVGQKLKLPEKPSTGSEVPQKEEEAGSTTITILGTSDVHGNLWGYTYEDSAETTNNGLARISTYVNEVKKTSPNVLLIDNGDTYQGNILTDDIYRKTRMSFILFPKP